ncbi:MAG: hypothetical protein ACOZCO_01600 [Bacteroidota bacterium]
MPNEILQKQTDHDEFHFGIMPDEWQEKRKRAVPEQIQEPKPEFMKAF